MSIVNDTNKDHVLSYEGLEDVVAKIKNTFVRNTKQASEDELGLIKALDNPDVQLNELQGHDSEGNNYPVQIISDGTAFVNLPKPETVTAVDEKVKNEAITDTTKPYFLLGQSSQNTTSKAGTDENCYIKEGSIYSSCNKVLTEANLEDSEPVQRNDNTWSNVKFDTDGFMGVDVPTIPESLKNPHALTIQGNGTTLDTYDGSTAKTINITQVNADWNETTTTSPAYIKNKPTIPTLPIWGEGLTYDSETNTLTGSTQYNLPKATTTELGGIKVYKTRTAAVTTDTSSGTAAVTRTGTGYCGVELDGNNKAFVYVPTATTSINGLIRVAKVNSGTQTAYTNGTTAYGLEVDGNGKAFVKIPQIPTYSAATTTNLGLIKVGSGLSITEDGTLSSTATTNITGSTTAAWYYPTFVTGTSATTENINSGFSLYAKNATSTTLGDITLNIGSAATDTVKAQPGSFRIFGESNNGVIRGPQGTNGESYTVFLPAEAGTLVVKNSSGTASCNISGSSGSCTGNAATATSATSATNASNIYINTSTSSSYYPMTFVTTASAGNTKLYIGGSTGTTSTGVGIRYNPSANTCYCSGGFYEASDERLKNFSNDIEVDLDKLSKLSKKYFTWKDDESNTQHIGVSAQEVQGLYPELVEVIDEEGHLSVSYDKISVIALKGIDILNDKIKSLEDRLSKIEQIIENKF